MTERLLQFIWQYQYFNLQDLRTEDGIPLQIIQPGGYNSNQGPDFQQASIRIDQTTLVGNVELHVMASDWYKHGHQEDINYKNVILHVVWELDSRKNLPDVPVLILQDRVSMLLLDRYHEWMHQVSFIPCEKVVTEAPELTWIAWKERLTASRMLRKSAYVLQVVDGVLQNWEEGCWQILAKNFGGTINGDLFEWIARSLPLTLLARHKNQPVVLEALLLGQARLLETEFTGEYPRLLQREYRFYKQKYRLVQPVVKVNFLRMRPAAFPTIRLAQLAVLLQQSDHFFTFIKETAELSKVKEVLNIPANDYWHYHYRFDEPAEFRIKNLGESTTESIIINSVVPLLFAYGIMHKENALKDKAVRWLTETPAEKNNITEGWQALGITDKDAYESQALIELKNNFCDKKRCLECAVGNALLKKNS